MHAQTWLKPLFLFGAEGYISNQNRAENPDIQENFSELLTECQLQYCSALASTYDTHTDDILYLLHSFLSCPQQQYRIL